MDFPGHFDQIFQQLNHQRLHGQLCDCVVAVGGRQFNAHRSVLAACSAHFRALFAAEEGGGGVARAIQLDGDVVTAAAFAVLVDMMYTSTLTLGESNVMDVLLAASHLHLNAVVKACKRYAMGRTVPLVPPRDRAAPRAPEQPHVPNGAPSRLQRSFLLQQLGLDLVGSTLGGMEDDVGFWGGSMEAEQRASLGARHGHRRKPPLSLALPEDRQRHCVRCPANAEEPLLTVATGGSSELFSPSSLKVSDGPKVEKGLATDEWNLGTTVPQDSAQVPSQSDCGRRQGEAKEERFQDDEGAVAEVVQDGDEEGQQQVRVVVKSEPLSSPEPGDGASDVASQVEQGVDKMELSPEGSERSFSDLRPSTGSLHLPGGTAGGGAGEPAVDSGCDSRQSLGVSGFLSSQGFVTLGNRMGSAGDDSVPNTTTGEFRADGDPSGYTLSPESSGASSLLLHPGAGQSQHFLPGEACPFSGDALFLRPPQDCTALGLPSPAPPSRGALSSLGFQGYRRIAPKVPPGGAKESQCGDTSHLEDPAAFPSTATGGTVFPNGLGYEGREGPHREMPTPRPKLTRASADVLSKCKKALSEHHVLVVEGAKKYACKICCKTFLTLTDCKKHIRVHTGERPYACLKCGKRFSQSSHLYKHSKTICLRWQNSNSQSSLL